MEVDHELNTISGRAQSAAPATGQVRILAPNATGHTITRADPATFLVDQLTTDANLNRAVTVVNTLAPCILKAWI